MWAGHLLAEPTNFIPPGPNETPHPNLEVQSHLYFVLIKARRASDRERTIWWFNGGPGCSSFDGLMMEVGPWRMNRNGELREIEGGWEEYANIVYSEPSLRFPSETRSNSCYASRPTGWNRFFIREHRQIYQRAQRRAPLSLSTEIIHAHQFNSYLIKYWNSCETSIKYSQSWHIQMYISSCLACRQR
jgi:hypothetical protein